MEFPLITGSNFQVVQWGDDENSIKEIRLKHKYFKDYHAIIVNDLKELLLSLAPKVDINDDRLNIALVLFVAGVLKAQDYNRGINIKLLAIHDNINLFTVVIG